MKEKPQNISAGKGCLAVAPIFAAFLPVILLSIFSDVGIVNDLLGGWRGLVAIPVFYFSADWAVRAYFRKVEAKANSKNKSDSVESEDSH